MKIYFAGSIRGGEPDREWFQQLIQHIKQYAQVMTEHSFDYSYDDEIKKDDVWIYTTDIGWLRESNAVIAEVTAPSLGVGYEIAKAEEWGIPVLMLYRDSPNRAPSAMLNGNKNLPLITYNEKKEAIDAINEFIKELRRGA
ncbi:nucleoside 2-deoxyribosyltransferase [Candidatus Bathyarchaeota archaeon]|nr:MAG: nucleoside 2-deoxyribosyltransferase [Candidatus Bathyarchaeota archaeon]HHL41676.1 nucleoside 2-deoxyribosyltransferase [Candidatus Bathyarchaeota archaeon]